jgi:hypothetical protein
MLLFLVYLTMFLIGNIVLSNDMVISEQWIERDVEGSGRGSN